MPPVSVSYTHLKTLKSYGNTIIPVGVGELASGLSGEGRMAEPEDIVQFVIHASLSLIHI